MLRLLVLTAFVAAALQLHAQGIGDMAIIAGSFTEERYRIFLDAARHDGDSTKVVMLKGLYGKYLTDRQLYPQAERALFEGLDIIKKMDGRLKPAIKLYKPCVYDVYDYLGEYFTHTGDYKNAEFFLKESERLRERDFARGSPHRLRNIQTLAEFYLETEQPDKGEQYLLKLIRELNHTRFNNEMLKNAYGTYFNGMTDVKIRQGKLGEAHYFLKKLVKFQAGPFSSFKGAMRRQSGTGKTLYYRSQILLMEGKTEEALSLIESGMGQARDSLTILPLLLRAKSIALFRKKDLSGALIAADQLLQVHLHNIDKVFYTLNEQEKETMFNRIKDDFDLYNSLIIEAAAGGKLEANYLYNMLNFRLQTKALLLNYSRKIRQAIFSSHDTTLINNYQTLSTLKNKVSQEVYKKSAIRKAALFEEEIKTLEKAVSRSVSILLEKHQEKVSAADLQARMQADEAGVEMLRVRKLGIINRIQETNQPVYGLTDTIRYWALIIDKSNISYADIPGGNMLETRYLTLFRNTIKIANSDTTLYHAFWRPLERATGKKKTIYFSGDGVYNQININLLKSGAGYVEDKTDVVLLSNLKEILKPVTKMNKGVAVFFGQPNFSIAATSSSAGTTREVRNFNLEEMKTSDFSDLPGTKVEIVNGSKLLEQAGWKTQSYTGDEALESNLKAVKNPTVLHIATHGFFLEGGGVNPMLRSGLVFAGVKNDQVILGEDGVLTAYEAGGLALDSTRLVVLSACETASGEVRTGEGIYGLQRAFLIAGASNIIMSLWKVDDTATQKLMSLFYQGIEKGNSIRDAFAHAQQSLRKEYPEPYYWGAFVLVGK